MKSDDKENKAVDQPPTETSETAKGKEPSTSAQQEPSTSSSTFPNSPESSNSLETAKDALFEPSVEMMVNDFDDEQTLEEEESLAAKEMQDPNVELSDLQREGEMPIEELLKLYGGPAASFTPSASGSRKRRRRTSPKPAKKPTPENLTEETAAQPPPPPSAAAAEEVAEESPDEDATTTTTNNLENQSIDDETNFDEEEPSELRKLYTGLYDKDAKEGELKLDQSLSDEEDLDYSPDEDEATKKTIMVGSDFQASIPEGLCKYDDALPYENEDKLLWDPSKLSDSDIEDFLNKFSTLASANGGTNYISQGGKHLRDDEQALHLLLQCGNNCDEALRRRRLGGVQPATTTMSIWSEEECRNFENGLRLHGKCFHEIQASKVKTRSVGECVQFYYLWKKTERHDVFANKARLEKKKYNLNPCVTDFMDKYLEEYDNNGGTNRDRSASPNVNNSNSLLLADSKHRIQHRGDSSASHNNEKKTSSGGENVEIKNE